MVAAATDLFEVWAGGPLVVLSTFQSADADAEKPVAEGGGVCKTFEKVKVAQTGDLRAARYAR